MNDRIRFIGLGVTMLFLLVFVQLNRLQVIQSEELANDPRNFRTITAAFNKPRGQIVTKDGIVIAETRPSSGTFKWQRAYPQPLLYSQITGYFSYNFGAGGIESEYNSQLQGKTREAKNLADYFNDRTITSNITTTIDSRVQLAAQGALAKEGKSLTGSIVALDPRDGSILAMYSNPSYDPNPLASHDSNTAKLSKTSLDKDPSKPMLGRAYQERYAPGSTMKLVTSTAAYETMPELVSKSYPMSGGLTLPNSGGRLLRNFGGGTCGGEISALLTFSCNTGFGQMGLDLGAQNLSDTANKFGFNQSPPIDLPGPAKSNFPTVDYFETRKPFLALSAIGQGDVAATPLQMALVASGVANAGTIMVPHVMREIRDSTGQLVQSYSPKPWTTPMTPATASSLRDLMVNVTKRGTATQVRIPGIDVAAKTGTAETGVEGQDNAWLVAFAPAQQPTVAVAVFVQDVASDEFGSFTGGQTAAPIAREILQAALAVQASSPTDKP